MRLKNLLAVVLAAGACGVAAAHEFWVHPATFRPQVGTNIGIALRVGDGFPGETRPRDPNKLESFVIAGSLGAVTIPGADGADPAGVHRFERPGVQVIGYRSKNSRIEMTGEKFESYLKEEGLEEASRDRAQRGETDAPAVELFSRCAKAIVSVGDPVEGDTAHTRVLGLTSEIVPDENPYLKAPGDTLRVKLLHNGSPRGDTQIHVRHSDTPGTLERVRTDAEGNATITLSKPGIYLLNAIIITRADTGSGADWQSVWSSLTFEVSAQTTTTPAAR